MSSTLKLFKKIPEYQELADEVALPAIRLLPSEIPVLSRGEWACINAATD